MKRTIDLRSDTVTQPTETMRQATASAVVGDDVYREDPTVNRLEEIDLDRVQTNIVLAAVLDRPARELTEALAHEGVLCTSIGGERIRFSMHYGIETSDLPIVIDAVARCLRIRPPAENGTETTR